MSNNNIEDVILMGIIHNPEFRRKALMKADPDFFEKPEYKIIVKELSQYFVKYDDIPSKETIAVNIDNAKGISDNLHKDSLSCLDKLYSDKFEHAASKINLPWLENTTQEYFKSQAVFNAVSETVEILRGENKKVDKAALPSLFEKALAINFDDGNFHNYFDNAEERYDYFHTPHNRIPFKLKMLNKITNGGILKKTLNIFVGPTGAGKTMYMCDQAADWLSEYNVLYVTLEMAEELIANRIDANLMDIEINDTTAVPKENFMSRIKKLRTSKLGQLFVKEFPPNNFTANDLGVLIDEIKQNNGVQIDIVLLDYLNLASAMRYKNSGENSYAYVKAIAEEFRACAIKKNFCLFTATQTNREGQNNSDFELNQVSESHGLSMTADFMIGGIVTSDLEAMKQMRLKQLKNRYGSLIPSSFIVGIDRAKMKMYDVDLPTTKLDTRIQQENLDNITPISNINKKDSKNQLKF